MLFRTLLDSVLIVFRTWVEKDPSLSHIQIETLDFHYPFTLPPAEVDWVNFSKPQHGPHGDPLAYFWKLAKDIVEHRINIIICPHHSGISKHYGAARLDFEKDEAAFGDSLRWAMKPHDREGLTHFFYALQKDKPPQ
ncbi:hypothetical protein OF83DRAFT_1177762 [Amylostereum chailletii]|nr:hypothetical protein OF83DRAFT_1177762 [Amylostereum chailletii]